MRLYFFFGLFVVFVVVWQKPRCLQMTIFFLAIYFLYESLFVPMVQFNLLKTCTAFEYLKQNLNIYNLRWKCSNFFSIRITMPILRCTWKCTRKHDGKYTRDYSFVLTASANNEWTVYNREYGQRKNFSFLFLPTALFFYCRMLLLLLLPHKHNRGVGFRLLFFLPLTKHYFIFRVGQLNNNNRKNN